MRQWKYKNKWYQQYKFRLSGEAEKKLHFSANEMNIFKRFSFVLFWYLLSSNTLLDKGRRQDEKAQKCSFYLAYIVPIDHRQLQLYFIYCPEAASYILMYNPPDLTDEHRGADTQMTGVLICSRLLSLGLYWILNTAISSVFFGKSSKDHISSVDQRKGWKQCRKEEKSPTKKERK